jgi:hypothetical protein
MSRYRLLPAPAQEAVLRDHCGHARYVWNLAVEQHAHWRPGRKGAPGYLEQCGQLTAARAGHPWRAAGSQTVQQQALRDFTRAMAAFFDPANPAGRPSWCKAGRDEGFRIVGRGRQWDVRRLSRKTGQVWVPKAGRENPGRNVRAKAGLNRGILGSGWGLLVRRLQDKAPGRVEKVRPAFTSQRRSACGHVDPESRESQPRFVCTACGFAGHADVNAAVNIAAGHAVIARGGDGVTRPVNREPHLLLQSA